MRSVLVLLAAAAALAAPGARERAAIRDRLYVPDPLPPLEAETHGSFEAAPGVIAERVTYATEYGMRVPAILYLPKERSGRSPAFVVVNGHGGDKYSWYAFYAGVLYARMGVVALTYDPIGEGERNLERQSGTRAHDRYVPPPETARRMGGLMMTDVIQAVSYLAGRPDVDPSRIAAGGYSMGSFVLALACAAETRLAACVLVGGGNLDGPGGRWDQSSKLMCQAIPYQSLQFLGDRPAVIYALQAGHARTFIFNGANDTVVAIPEVGKPAFFDDLRRRAIALGAPREKTFEFAYEPGNASHRPYFVTRPVVQWLDRQLRFPKPVPPGPDVRIGDWAGERRVEMDKTYADEDREGGTRAVPAGVPGLTREQLSVLPAAEWEKQKDRFTLESWLAQTKLRLRENAADSRSR